MMKKTHVGLILTAFAAIFLSSCYYTKQGYYLLSYQAKAKPVEKLLADKNLDVNTRNFLTQVEAIRTFALSDLGLEENKNYTTFLDLDQDVLAWVVSACDPLSFNTYLWNYPVMGKMPYKGFYEQQDSVKEARKILAKNKDVWVRGVEAFSTLGYFKDPLISYMKDYSVYDIANLIIHEQTHAAIWKDNDPSFNEDLASFVGDVGARLYVASLFGEDSPEYLSIDENEANEKRFREDIFLLREKLEAFYQTLPNPLPKDDEIFLAEKKRIIEDFQNDFLALYDERYTTENYRGFSTMQINNAYIDLYHIYNGDRETLEQLFAEAGSDMKTFIEMMKEKIQ
jgi:predicted aminopeptidase